MEGLKIACLYSLGCPELLKEKKAQEILSEFIRRPEKEKAPLVKEILKKLEPFIFYQLISFQNGIADPFAENVVRAYWLGNDLLKKITKREVENFFGSKLFLEHHKLKLIKILDLIGGKPHHNWETLWLIKKTKGKQALLEKFLASLNNCLISAGKVICAEEGYLKVKTKRISLKNGKIILEDIKSLIGPGFVKQVKEKDFVSIHLSQAREKIEKETAKSLSKITQEAVSFLNRVQ